MQAGISEAGGVAPAKTWKKGLGKMGGEHSRGGDGRDRQGGCAGRWGDWAGRRAGRTRDPASTAETRAGCTPPRGLCSEAGSRQLRLASGGLRRWRRAAWGHQHPGDTDARALGRTNPRAAAALRGREGSQGPPSGTAGGVRRAHGCWVS